MCRFTSGLSSKSGLRPDRLSPEVHVGLARKFGYSCYPVGLMMRSGTRSQLLLQKLSSKRPSGVRSDPDPDYIAKSGNSMERPRHIAEAHGVCFPDFLPTLMLVLVNVVSHRSLHNLGLLDCADFQIN